MICKVNNLYHREFYFNQVIEAKEDENDSVFYLKRVTLNSLIHFTCALLNGGGGKVYCGINEKKMVQGIKMDRK